MSASRLLGNIFGTSNLVWSCIIGLILVYLAAGYFFGGRWADRSPHLKTLYSIMAWGAFSSGLIPVCSQPVLRLAANAFDELSMGILIGSFTVVLVLFSIPVTLLGVVSPFAIRLAIEGQENSGRISGYIYAISTAGSFVGTFLPTLLLIPLVGTARTFVIFSAVLTLTALAGLYQAAKWRGVAAFLWMPILIIILWIIGSGPIKATQGQVYETESAYNYIQVLEQDGYRFLRLNEGQGVHSTWHPSEISFDGPWEQFLVAPFFNQGQDGQAFRPEQVQNMAILGLAAGTLARQATEVFGEIPIDGYEIDPEIIEVGQAYFDMNEPNLNAIAQDGRWGLEHSHKKYSLIGVDAYRPPYIPWHLTTYEFFQMVHDHLTDNGVLAINVGRAPEDRRLIDGLVGTIQAVFPSVYVMDIPDTFNSIIYATLQPTEIKNLHQNLLYLYTREDIHPLLILAMEKAVVYQQPYPETNVIFTDDKAPIEWLTNNLVLNFIFTGDMELVQ
ncbi:MAG: fused MFS/spermidine synthase [Anaerolineales bacterium]|nr:fused MFS/spermidine synthase [Anaerolineales bacterium]